MKPSILSLANNIGLVLLGLIMLSSCSTDTDEISKVYEQLSELTQKTSEIESFTFFSPGIYEGEWNGLFCESEKGSVEIRHDSVCFVLPEASISRFLVDVLMDTYVSEFHEHRMTANGKQIKYIREEIIADYVGNEAGAICERENRYPTIEENKVIIRKALLLADELIENNE